MSIKPLVFNGMIQNTTEVSNVHSQAEHQPRTSQENIAIQTQQQTLQQSQQVAETGESAEDKALNPDDSGGGAAGGGRNRKKKKEEKEDPFASDGKVTLKGSQSTFSISI